MIKTIDNANLANDTFYGFKLDKNGNLEVHMIDDDTMPVTLLEDNDTIINDSDYKQSVWSDNHLDFSFNSNNGHLMMKII